MLPKPSNPLKLSFLSDGVVGLTVRHALVRSEFISKTVDFLQLILFS